MNHRGDFQESLRLGKECEDIALTYLKEMYPSTSIREGYFKEHDIYIPEIEKSVEVKLDMVAKDSGNFGIEIYCNGKPSGISTTTANKWFIFQDTEVKMFVSITVDRLKELCKNHKHNRGRVWLDKPAELVLIPCLELLMEAKIISY